MKLITLSAESIIHISKTAIKFFPAAKKRSTLWQTFLMILDLPLLQDTMIQKKMRKQGILILTLDFIT